MAQGLSDRGWHGRTVVVGPGWLLDQARLLTLPVDLIPLHRPVDLGFLRKLIGVVRTHGIGLIHAHLLNSAAYASVVAHWTGIPVVATYHGASDVYTGKWTRSLEHRVVRRRTTVVCVSEALRNDLRHVPGAPRSGIEVVHNGVDVDHFARADGAAVRREHRIPDGAILVGALGNMRPAKDYPNFLRAAALLSPDDRFVFAIAGEASSPFVDELMALRDRLGLATRVSFWGFRGDAAAVLSAFDALVISSSSEGFSLAAVQAMAAGTPVVATRSGGPEEIIRDGQEGLLVPTKSPEHLAAAVRRLTDDAELRSVIVARGGETASRRFSLESMLNGYEAVYERLTADRTGRPN